MSFRKIFYLMAALVMTFGANDLFAQEAAPRGTRVRLVSPDSAAWAGIGKTIKVNVLRTKTLAPTLNTVIVALRADSLAPSGQTSLTTASFSADSLGLLGSGAGANRYVDTLTAANGAGSSVDTFKFTFTVTVGDPEASKVFAQAFIVDGNSATAVHKLNNLNTTAMSTVTGFTDPVGDKKFVKVDGLRPVNGSIFDSVLVDTAASTANFPGTTSRAFKIGDQIKLKMHVKNFNAATAKFGIYDNAFTHADSALYSKTFTAAQVVSATNGIRDSFTITAGQFKINGGAKKNNLRTSVIAFLVDNAGNLSANSSTSASAEGYSQAITYVIDSNAPTVTIAHPDSTTDRFTGRIDTSITYRQDGGAVSATTFSLSPLKFKANEGTSQRWAITGTDTAEFNGTSSTADISFVTTDSFSASKTAKGGKEFDLSVVVTDSVGNKTTNSVSKVVHDQIAPVVSNLFPQSASLPEDKINNITRHPVFQISEVADSISVRFVQAGSSPPDVATQSVSTSKLSTVGSDISVTVNDSLITGSPYSLQVHIYDTARNKTTSRGNVGFTTLDTLTFDKNFQNPTADSFTVSVNEDSVLAGQSMTMTVTAIDSKLTRQAGATRKAVTYNKSGVLLSASSGTDAVTTVSFWGLGVTDNGDGTANLDGLNWVIGERTVWIKSNLTVDALKISVEDTSTTIVDGTATKVVNFNGGKDKLTVDAADLRKFAVTAWEGDDAATSVSKGFGVKVIPTDAWGNASMKIFAGGALSVSNPPVGADSLKLLDTRLTKANSRNVLEGVSVVFSANDGRARVPSGPQTVTAEGATFTVVAPNGTGEGLTISVGTANVSGDSSGANKQLQASGSVTVSFVPHGQAPAPPTGGDAPAAPANLVVQDYLGSDGGGDQGFYVMVSFPHSAGATSYRLFRELSVNTGLGEDGSVVVMAEPMLKWVPWTSISPDAGGDINRAVVPVTDTLKARWAISAVNSKGGSAAVAAKRVFTKESVQQMAQFFGVDPNRIVSPEELGEMFMPSADYIKSIIGDQENVIFAALDPDVSSILGVSSVPQNIRTNGAKETASARTLSEHAVAAVDNIAPAAVEASADGNALSWPVSSDDRTVGYLNYRGFSIPIAGVTTYEILNGADEASLEVIGSVPAGSQSYDIEGLTGVVRVDALDLDNRAIGNVVPVGGEVAWNPTGPGGVTLYPVAGPNSSTPFKVDFEDFIAFAGAFGANEGDENYNLTADTNGDGNVGFPDFIAFAGVFGLEAVDAPASKPVILLPGVNENAEFSLRLGSDRVIVGETVSVDVSLANVQSLVGFGFTVNYDASNFEFVDAAPADQDLLKSTGGETPVFFKQSEAGVVTIANAVVNGAEVSGGGDIVRLTFRVLQEFKENVRFEVAEGLVFDPNQLSNPAVVAGVLQFTSTPTEFALLQNFPNPFNPETTIGYELAESADVTLQVYNVVGQVVRTLVAEPQTAGRYQIRWNGMDDRGTPVSSGIYFYQVSAGKFQDVRKLMLLK